MSALRGFEEFVLAYIECALWSSTDENGVPLDENYDDSDLCERTYRQMLADCAGFWNSHGDRFRWDASKAGHRFWLSRNGHGCGFEDETLHRVAKTYGTFTLYAGENGEVDH